MAIDESDLDLDEDVSVFQGQPYTGLVQAFYLNGAIKKQMTYCEGFEEGQCREWYANGQLKIEWYAVRGTVNAKAFQWHENGLIKSIANYVHGAELSFDEWDDSGLLVNHREIDWQSELGKYVSRLNSQE